MSTKEKNLHLKRCVSNNEISVLNLSNLTLREAKSYAGAMVGSKFYESLENQRPQVPKQNAQDNCMELFGKDFDGAKNDNKSVIPTKDALTQEIFYVNDDILNYKGTCYTIHEVASIWKKDCRMWLWKNDKKYKMNRSVAEIRSL